jgi:peptidyl-prolyl cis-trans isomerase D
MPDEKGKKPVIHTRKHMARLERERRQTRLILFVLIGIIIAVIGLLVYGYLDLNVFQGHKPVAKVGNAEISATAFETRVRLQRQQMLSTYNLYLTYQQFGLDVSSQLQQIQTSLDAPVEIGQNVLDQMIDEELIRQEAAKRGLSVSKAELEQAIQANFDFYPNGSPTPTLTATEVIFPTIPAAAFEIVTITPTPSPTQPATATPVIEPTLSLLPSPTATLEPASPTPGPSATPEPTETPFPTATPYTEQGYQQRFEKTIANLAKQHFTEADYRNYVETQLLRDKLFKLITADIQPVQEQVWARHILVKDQTVAQVVEQRLKKGEDFGALAKEVSQDTGSATNGGDLGWFGKGTMVAPFEQAAFSLQPGQISDPVQSNFGWHIIQVIARQNRPLTAQELDQARNKAFQDWLTKARVDYGVQTFDLWKTRVPTEPNFNTMATQAVYDQQTALAEQNLTGTAAVTPAP